MRKYMRVVALSVGAIVLGACTACSTDSLVWGSDGAAVRATAEQVIDDMKSLGDSSKICADAEVDTGSANAWRGLAAGEPEEYTGKEWEGYAEVAPAWFINLSPGEEAVGGSEIPSFLFLRGSKNDLCVAAIEWSELATETD